MLEEKKLRNLHVIVTIKDRKYVLLVLNSTCSKILYKTAPVEALAFGSPCYYVGSGSLGDFWLCLNNPTNMNIDLNCTRIFENRIRVM